MKIKTLDPDAVCKDLRNTLVVECKDEEEKEFLQIFLERLRVLNLDILGEEKDGESVVEAEEKNEDTSEKNPSVSKNAEL